MDKFTKLNINDIPLEEAHGGSGARQVLVKPGGVFDWHFHQDTDEIFIVLKGEGKYFCEEEITEYKVGDIMITPANLKHKIEALGEEESEYYFIRVKAK